jgi:hypothetical protein
MKRFSPFLLLVLAALSCGRKPEEKPPAAATTPYGSPQEVADFLNRVDPLVAQLNAIHQELYQQVGTSGKATGANLAPAMEKGRPRLAEILAQLENLAPPPLLAPFHEQVKKVVGLRLDAYAQTLEGWRLEREKSPEYESHYARGEQYLSEAQQLGARLGAERERIQIALAAAQPPQAASR